MDALEMERLTLKWAMILACILVPALYLAGDKFAAFIWSFDLAVFTWLYRRKWK